MEVKKGKFIRMEEGAREIYILSIKRKIEAGFYSSDKVLDSIIERIGPYFENELDSV